MADGLTHQRLMDQARQLREKAAVLGKSLGPRWQAVVADIAKTGHLYANEMQEPKEWWALENEMDEVRRLREYATMAEDMAAARVPTKEDHKAALETALACEMARRRWPQPEAISLALKGKRQQLEWNQMQPWPRRLIANVLGEYTSITREIQQLESDLKKSLERENGLRQHLLVDPISSSILNENAARYADERAERHEEAEFDQYSVAQRDRSSAPMPHSASLLGRVPQQDRSGYLFPRF